MCCGLGEEERTKIRKKKRKKKGKKRKKRKKKKKEEKKGKKKEKKRNKPHRGQKWVGWDERVSSDIQPYETFLPYFSRF